MDNSRFNRNDNLAPFFDSSKQKKMQTQRSAFDYGRSHSFQLKFGMLSVADCFPTLPNSNYKLSCNLNALFRNPTVRKLINNCRIFVEYFYCREGDLWEGAHNTITKGRSGNIQKQYPSLGFSFLPPSPQPGVEPVAGTFFAYDTPDSLIDDFGLPCTHEHNRNYEGDDKISPINSFMPVIANDNRSFMDKDDSLGLENNDNLYINALPFFMYQKVWRDYYLNKNLSYSNEHILPDNEEHFIIPYEQDTIYYLDYNQPFGNNQITAIGSPGMSDKLSDINMSDSNTPLMLAQKRFRQYRGDYFTTAFPFPDGIRGDIPTLDLSVDVSDLSITVPGSVVYASPLGGPNNGMKPVLGDKNGSDSTHGSIYQVFSADTGIIKNQFKTDDTTVPVSDITGFTSITLNDIRQLEAFTKFQERMARTDGDYAEMVNAQFGSKTVKTSRKPIYIGGFYQDILVNSVYQTSESTSDSPLGRQSGIGVSTGEHYIGDFYSDDYGYIMAIISCVPEVYYINGIDKMFSTRTQSDKYFPLMNELPPQPVLNKELFVSGDDSIDNDVFAYAERFSEFKSRRNLITGKGRFFSPIASGSSSGLFPIDEYDSARVIMRRFKETPNFNNDFVQATDVDMSPFSVRDEMPLDIDFGSKVTAVLPMPYVTLPGGVDEN